MSVEPGLVFWVCSTGFLTNGRIIQQTSSQFRVFSSSDGGLKHSNISSFNEVFILPINQRVPLIKFILQTCKIKKIISLHSVFCRTWNLTGLTKVALQEGKCGLVGEVDGELGVDLPL